jgi:predicted amidohydrolase
VSDGALSTVACVQLAPVLGDAASSLARAEAGVRAAAERGAGIVVLPELASSGYVFEGPAELESAAEPLDGPFVSRLTELAAQLRIVIVSGFAERDASGDVFNSAVLVDAGGIRATYRKAHLWNTEKTAGFVAGTTRPPVVDTAFGRIGLMVCYDLEFAEWVRMVALDGAELLCAPVNWPLYPRPEGERPGEIIRVQTDAAVNRMFIAVADRTGRERGQDWLGGTVIVDADGYPVSDIRLGEDHIAIASLPLAEARNKSISPRNDVHADRRPELYD